MNSISWRSITELVAAISIVISLVFVGYELRENSAIARSDSFSAYTLAVAEINFDIATDPILTPLIRRVTEGGSRNEFDGDERYRVFLFYQGILNVYEGLFRAIEEGILPSNDLSSIFNIGLFGNIYFEDLWSNSLRHVYSPGFIEFFETLEWNTASN